MLEKILETAKFIKGELPTLPKIAIILGTGLGELVHEISDKKEIPYETIPNFPVSTVEGHSGKLIYGKLGGEKKYWPCKDVFIITKGMICER